MVIMCPSIAKFVVFLVLVNVSQSSIFTKIDEGKSPVENDAEDGTSSLVFVFDTTGSMHNDLKQLREGAEMILNTALEESDIIGDFVFVPFHDPAVGPATVTRDKKVFKTALDLVNVYGGGDCPEKSLGGIQLALNVSEPRSFIYVFTDATAGDHRLVGKVLDAVQRKQSQVVFMLTGHCNDLEKPTYKVYQQIAAASSGQVFNLNKTSVHKVLDFVKSSIKGRMVNLGSSVNPAGYNFTQGIPVDSSLGEVTVSVSGAKPQITVVNPSGEQLTGPPKLVTTLDLSEIMVVKVIQPEPGNWTITVGSEEDYSVKVVGLSNLTFNHGFSVEPPRTMAETSYRPLEGTYNHMMISLSQSDSPVKIDYAEILTLGGKTLFEVPLKEVEDGDSRIYRAEAFIPPDEFFYIAINGRDESNQDIRRIGATAVQAKLPDAPYLTTPRKVEAHSHSRVVIKCKVESLVPVNVMFTKDKRKIYGPISSLQTTAIEYVIKDMTEEDVGTYICIGKNVAGISKAATEVTLLVDAPQVSIKPPSLNLQMGNDANLTCTVFSEALLLKFQFVRDYKESYEAIDLDVEPNLEGIYTFNITVENATETDAGNYTCVAANRGGSSNETAVILVQSEPTAQILGPHELSAQFYHVVTLYCTVENSGAISWTNNGTVWKETSVSGSYTDSLAVNVTDDGVWTCKAVRGGFEASDSVQIFVLLKPVVNIQGSRNVTVVNGTTQEILCQVVAKPQPRIVWYRGKEEKFLNNTIEALDSKTYKSTLRLNSSAEDIRGTYFCVGENSVGIHEDSVAVHVRRNMRLIRGFNDTSVRLYYQVELHCDIDGYPTPQIKWLHNSTELILNQNVQISEDGKIVYIGSVNFDNLGLYSCEAVNEYEKMEVTGSLRVYGLDVPVLSKGPTKKVIKQGESAIITCRVLKGNPEPTINWQYKNANSDNFTALRVTNEDSSKIVINNVTVDDVGVYRCVAENVLGTDQSDVEVVVHYPPQFPRTEEPDVAQRRVEVAAGGAVTLSCAAEGAPPPAVAWERGGRPMLYGKHSHSTNTSLVLDKVTEYDSGMFTCTVKNPIGSVQKNFTLFVYVPPTISTPTTDTEQEILEGQLVELPCDAKGVPSPEVVWRHNGEVISDASKYVDEFGIRFVANVTDFGDYTCIAKNQYGNASLTYSLFIWVPPYIEPSLEVAKHVVSGANASLQCDVVGFPLPTVRWSFREKPLEKNTTDLSFNEVGNLYITNTSSKHEGAYVCIAENIAGVARKFTYLNVHEPPKILEENYTGPYLATNLDSAVTIACRATGKPKPYVVWSKDDYYLKKDVRYDVETDGSLTIKSPTEDMSGSYTCTAKNSVGTTNRTVEVMVYSLPTQMQAEEAHPVVTVMEHTNTSVECPTRASHTDTVKWYKDAIHISTGKLQINNISRDDQSTYACVVSNAVGSAYSAISLNVEWPPEFFDEIENDEHDKVDMSKKADADINTAIDNLGDTNRTANDTANKNAGTTPVTNTDKNNDTTVVTNGSKVSNGTTINIDNNNTEVTQNDRAAVETEIPSIKTKMNDKVINSDKSADKNVKDARNVSSRRTSFGNPVKIIEVVKGGDTYFDCSVDAKPIAKTKWLFNSKPIIFENRERLKLINVHPRNAGSYKCIVGNAHGTILKEFLLNVLEPPFISEFDVLDVMLMEGVNASLECDARGSPDPTVQWTFNNKNWHTDKSSLTATNISSASAGLYRCDARNKAGAAHIVYRVSVVSGARIIDVVSYSGGEGTSVTGTVEAELGSRIRIACKATGTPPPAVQWLRNGNLLAENKPEIDYADLTIEAVQAAQAGAYTCVAGNEGGSGERNIRLEVLESPKIFQTLFQSENNSGNTVNLEVLSGQAYYLHCHAYGNPIPELYWFRDGLPLMFYDESMVSTEFGEIIVVKQALEAQSGNYTCVARNKVGNTSVVYLVDVLVPPPQAKSPTRVRARAGAALALACPAGGAGGAPPPAVAWHKRPYTLIGVHTPRVLLIDDNVTLIINSTVVSDSGNYSCVMSNKVGSTEVVFDVNIEKPPSIAGNVGANNVESHEVALLKSIVLKCEADGHPLPRITWLKDTQELSDSLSNINRVLGNSLLAVWRVTPRDAGQYICVVENEAGTAHRRYNVVVKVPGKWNSWDQWSFCNVTCGLGHQQRSRSCQYIDENNNVIDKLSSPEKYILDESACKGPSIEKRKCHMPPCEEEGPLPSGWSPWSRWAACSASCGRGTHARTRRCRRRPCVGDNVQIRKCPDLPKCSNEDKTENDDFDTDEEINENNAYAPEAIFEREPELVNSHYSPDVEEFYLATGSKQSTVFYDMNVTSNLDGSDPGPCAFGFRYNSSENVCDDIDECVMETNQCHSTQVCVNVAGAYRCTCSPGLLSLGAGQRCMDINECTQDISGCEYACVNVVGGYVCACPPHMRLHADKHHCYPVRTMASHYPKPYSYEDLDTGEYLSTSVEYPARYKHTRN